MAAEYNKPTFPATLFNPLIGLLTRVGLKPQGAWLLTVKGRKTGKPMSIPVNPLTLDGTRYLVAPRGNTHWARNLRASGEGELRSGRTRETIRTTELPDSEKREPLLAYLERWSGVTKEHFGIAWPNPSEDEITRVAARSPIFRIES